MMATPLAFVAALQIYGQARAERYKKLADARIRRISAGVNSIGSAVNSIGSDLSRLTAYLTSEDETTSHYGDWVKTAGRREQRDLERRKSHLERAKQTDLLLAVIDEVREGRTEQAAPSTS